MKKTTFRVDDALRLAADSLHRERVDEVAVESAVDAAGAVISPPVEPKRPYWLTGPCPAWCVGYHVDHDAVDDRVHYSSWEGVTPLSLMDLGQSALLSAMDGEFLPVRAFVSLNQGYREIEPRVLLSKDETAEAWYMTPAEARLLAASLEKAADVAEFNLDPEKGLS